MARIFVSYSRKNIDFCKRLTALLSGKNCDRFQNSIPISGKIARHTPNMGLSFDFQTLSQSWCWTPST